MIYRNKPDYRAAFKQIIKEATAGYGGWQLDGEEASWIRFHPVSWNQLGGMWAGTGWTSEILMLCQFYCTDNNVHFYFTLSPGEYDTIRKSIIESVRQNQRLFNRSGLAMTATWMSIHVHESILDDSDLNNWDDDDAPGPAKLRQWITNFAENEFPAMNDVIMKRLEEYEAPTRNQ